MVEGMHGEWTWSVQGTVAPIAVNGEVAVPTTLHALSIHISTYTKHLQASKPSKMHGNCPLTW